MSFLAVLREGLETSVFLLAVFQQSENAMAAGIGAVLGIAVAVVDRLRHLPRRRPPGPGQVLPHHGGRAGVRRGGPLRVGGPCRARGGADHDPAVTGRRPDLDGPSGHAARGPVHRDAGPAAAADRGGGHRLLRVPGADAASTSCGRRGRPRDRAAAAPGRDGRRAVDRRSDTMSIAASRAPTAARPGARPRAGGVGVHEERRCIRVRAATPGRTIKVGITDAGCDPPP